MKVASKFTPIDLSFVSKLSLLLCLALLSQSCGLEISGDSPLVIGGDDDAGGIGTDPDVDAVAAADGVDPGQHRIFVTSTIFPNGNLGGLAGADALCQGLADNQGFSLNYTAILSIDVAGSYASDRVVVTGPVYKYVGTTKTLVANNEAELWNATAAALSSPVDRDETGALAVGGAVFTGTSSTGTAVPAQNCLDWVSTSAFEGAARGAFGSTSGTWLKTVIGTFCDQGGRLYCVSQ